MQKGAVVTLRVALVFAVYAAEALAQSGWNRFSPEGGNFSVLMPGNPKLEVETKIGSFGPYTSYIFSETKAGTYYMIGWADYAPNVGLNVHGELIATRDNFLKSTNGTLIAESEINLDGHPGLEFTAEMKGSKLFVISRTYVVGSRPYQIAAVTKPKFDRTGANRFIWSFKLDAIR